MRRWKGRLVFAVSVVLVGLAVASAGAVVLTVTIDIKPGSDPNTVNCSAKAKIAVAVLTTNDFDATSIDVETVNFEGASEYHAQAHLKDVNGDGFTDLLLHFRYDETTLDCLSTEGTLTGQTYDGTPFAGTDSLRMVGG